MNITDVQGLLGGPWPEPPALETESLETLDRGDYLAERISYQLEPGERTEAWLLTPKSSSMASGSRFPGIAIWHQHNDEYHLGKSESAGFAGNQGEAALVHQLRLDTPAKVIDRRGHMQRLVRHLQDILLHIVKFECPCDH